MYYVYILQNSKGIHYIGGCQNNIEKRLRQHTKNNVRSTKCKGPFILIYKEGLSTRTEARKRENELKRYKSPQYLRKLLNIDSTPSSSPV
ncbi:MAG: GIY-YIG nuclease family protein [Candidatus Omnitrophota bacterium]